MRQRFEQGNPLLSSLEVRVGSNDATRRRGDEMGVSMSLVSLVCLGYLGYLGSMGSLQTLHGSRPEWIVDDCKSQPCKHLSNGSLKRL